MRVLLSLVLAIALLSCGQPKGDQPEGDSKASSKSGDRVTIQNKGSDTLVNVAQAWAEAYGEKDSKVALAVSGGGSGTGIAALINGTVDIANASRAMKEKELEQARANGHEPVQYIVGYDALAVFVHKDNPVESLTTTQLAEIYGEGGKTESWSDLGLTIPGCDSNEIIRISRQNNSGTYAYFRNAVLGKQRDFKLGSRDLHGSKDVVDLVENTPCAIGYSGLAYATDHLKMVCITSEDGQPCVMPSIETASDRSYPIARPLFMYTEKDPSENVKTYMDWILSDEGQCILKKKGYAPVRDCDCPE